MRPGAAGSRPAAAVPASRPARPGIPKASPALSALEQLCLEVPEAWQGRAGVPTALLPSPGGTAGTESWWRRGEERACGVGSGPGEGLFYRTAWAPRVAGAEGRRRPRAPGRCPWICPRAPSAPALGGGRGPRGAHPAAGAERGLGDVDLTAGFPGGRVQEWGPGREGLEGRQGAGKPKSPLGRFQASLPRLPLNPRCCSHGGGRRNEMCQVLALCPAAGLLRECENGSGSAGGAG